MEMSSTPGQNGEELETTMATVKASILEQDPDALAAALNRMSRTQLFALGEGGRGRQSAKLLAVLLQTASKQSIRAILRLAESMLLNSNLRSRRMFCFAFRRRSQVLCEAIIASLDRTDPPSTYENCNLLSARPDQQVAPAIPREDEDSTWRLMSYQPRGLLRELQAQASKVATRVLAGTPCSQSMPYVQYQRAISRSTTDFQVDLFSLGPARVQPREAVRWVADEQLLEASPQSNLSPSSEMNLSRKTSRSYYASSGGSSAWTDSTTRTQNRRRTGRSAATQPDSVDTSPLSIRTNLLEKFCSTSRAQLLANLHPRAAASRKEAIVDRMHRLQLACMCVRACIHLEFWAMNFTDSPQLKAKSAPILMEEEQQDKYRILYGILKSPLPRMLVQSARSMLPITLSTAPCMTSVLRALLSIICPAAEQAGTSNTEEYIAMREAKDTARLVQPVIDMASMEAECPKGAPEGPVAADDADEVHRQRDGRKSPTKATKECGRLLLVLSHESRRLLRG